MSHSERMSSVDTTWLRMDRPHNLMTIVTVWILEGPVALDRVDWLDHANVGDRPARP